MTRHGRRAVRRAIERAAALLRRRMAAHGVYAVTAPVRKGECGRLEWRVNETHPWNDDPPTGTVRVWWNVPTIQNRRGEWVRQSGGGYVEVEFDRMGRSPYAMTPPRNGMSGPRAVRALWPGFAAQLRDRDLPPVGVEDDAE